MKIEPKIYVRTVATTFPKFHPKKGKETFFPELIQNEVKKHTIRPKYEQWLKYADEINSGEAVLSVRRWVGVPYRSKQEEITQLTKIGVQKIRFSPSVGWLVDGEPLEPFFKTNHLAENDGLTLDDLNAWFFPSGKAYSDSEICKQDFAIVHFTNLRYEAPF